MFSKQRQISNFPAMLLSFTKILIVNVKESNKRGGFMVTLGATDCALNFRIVFFASPEVAQKKHQRCSK